MLPGVNILVYSFISKMPILNYLKMPPYLPLVLKTLLLLRTGLFGEKLEKEFAIFRIFVLKILQVQKAISYHLSVYGFFTAARRQINGRFHKYFRRSKELLPSSTGFAIKVSRN